MGIREDVSEVKKQLEEVKQENIALEILGDFKKSNKRMFTIIILILSMWFITIGYLVYLLNDIGVIEETTEVSQDNEGGNNNYIGNDGDIIG